MSDETDAAAHVAHVASQAADALAKTASHAAAAVVEVAAEAHASMAPSVLVVTMFGTLERQLEHLSKQVSEIHEWKDGFERRADKRHGGLDTLVGTLVKKVEIQNGGVTRALDWQNTHDTRLKDEANIARGEQNVKDKARGRVAWLWGKVEKPTIYGAGFLVFGVGVRIGAFLLGGVSW